MSINAPERRLLAAPEQPRTDYTEEESIAIRDFVVEGLALSVPKFMTAKAAEDLVVEWFPADRTALAGLYRRIDGLKPRWEAV